MKTIKFLLLVGFLINLSANVVNARNQNTFYFSRDLTIGSEGQDVYVLQKILNSFAETKIADSGAGSPGNESTYFGILTKKSVEKFQEKYADYVLKPRGLTVPDGYFEKNTYEFINKYFLDYYQNVLQAVSSQNNSSKKPIINNIKPGVVQGKTKLTISGKNFTDKNDIFISFESVDAFRGIKSNKKGNKIEFTFESEIQKTLDTKYANLTKEQKKLLEKNFSQHELEIYVQNENGYSDLKKINFKLKL